MLPDGRPGDRPLPAAGIAEYQAPPCQSVAKLIASLQPTYTCVTSTRFAHPLIGLLSHRKKRLAPQGGCIESPDIATQYFADVD
jgi:hypothetical protein